MRDNAAAILETLVPGRMPCYAAWDDEKIGLFRRWREQGKAD